MKIIFSGVKPTGRPHIGNYFGAMRQFVELQNKGFECFISIVDYHGLNFIQNGEEMRSLIYNLALDYLAIGLDPDKSIIFQQSTVPEHTELCWVFDTITTMPYLSRAHAFKDAEAKNKEINVGTFNYPMLMAADILIYDTDIVPVGQDQKQHVEYARDTAEKFNRIFAKESESAEVEKTQSAENIKSESEAEEMTAQNVHLTTPTAIRQQRHFGIVFPDTHLKQAMVSGEIPVLKILAMQTAMHISPRLPHPRQSGSK